MSISMKTKQTAAAHYLYSVLTAKKNGGKRFLEDRLKKVFIENEGEAFLNYCRIFNAARRSGFPSKIHKPSRLI